MWGLRLLTRLAAYRCGELHPVITAAFVLLLFSTLPQRCFRLIFLSALALGRSAARIGFGRAKRRCSRCFALFGRQLPNPACARGARRRCGHNVQRIGAWIGFVCSAWGMRRMLGRSVALWIRVRRGHLRWLITCRGISSRHARWSLRHTPPFKLVLPTLSSLNNEKLVGIHYRRAYAFYLNISC